MEKLLEVTKELRNPETGCPWDREQTFSSISYCAIEEAYEVVEAIEEKDYESLKSELGDLLFQVVFHCEMAKEMNLFDFDDVVNAISEKLISRHPHVFGGATIDDVKIQTDLWERQKIQEMQKSGKKLSVLDGIGKNQPALNRALKLGKRASSVGFDWQSTEDVMIKISEELEELTLALKSDEAVAENSKIIKSRLEVLAKSAKDIGLEFVEPDGAMYLFAKTKYKDFDATKFSEKLLERGVAIAPGEGFGDYKEFFRLTAIDETKLKEGMIILDTILKESYE